MHSLRRGTAAETLVLAVLLLVISATTAHNITQLLAKHPEFSTFNHYLTTTHLAPEINRRATITVCVVDNTAMSDLLSKQLSIYSIKNTLSLHVLLDYFGAKKLHQITNGTALAATMFQATGSAPGASGFVNITDLKGGKVGFGLQDGDGDVDAFYVKSVEELAYNISVIQISKILPSQVAEAPTPSPSEMNLTGLMSAHGCKIFADTLQASDAVKTFQENAIGGLTIFCPMDDVFKAFLPKFKNLTVAGKISLLEYHGLPVYMSMSMLKSNNGPINTLATDGANYNFVVQNDGEVVTLQTKVVTAKVTGTLLDEQPVAIFTINKVLKPRELFKKEALTPAPAPAPESDKPADAPKAHHSRGHKGSATPEADSPADSPSDDDAADQTADKDGAARLDGWRFVLAGVSGLVALLLS